MVDICRLKQTLGSVALWQVNSYPVLWTSWDRKKCPDYQGVLIFQVILYDKVQFGTSAKCLDYAGVHIFKCPH